MARSVIEEYVEAHQKEPGLAQVLAGLSTHDEASESTSTVRPISSARPGSA
jgi:hypothetical protein